MNGQRSQVAAHEVAAVSRRAVFLIGGYERNSPSAFFARISKEASRFRACWSVDAEIGPVRHGMFDHAATARVSYRDGGRATDTDFTFLNFDDIVARDAARPLVVRVARYLIAFLDYVASGTVFRFFAANWRFALYFLYPFMAALVSVLLGAAAWRLAEPLLSGRTIAAALAGLAVSVVLLWRLGRKLFLFHLMDLWSFSDEYLHGRRPEMDGRLEDWATAIDRQLATEPYDEVILVGHSTGGALILDLAAYIAARATEAGRKPAFSIMTIGSTALKIGLHPAARAARQRLESLTVHDGIFWVEYQSLTDMINFYRCDPLAMAGISHRRPEPFPTIHLVRFQGDARTRLLPAHEMEPLPRALPVHFGQHAAIRL